jgi:hypothetical protein
MMMMMDGREQQRDRPWRLGDLENFGGRDLGMVVRGGHLRSVGWLANLVVSSGHDRTPSFASTRGEMRGRGTDGARRTGLGVGGMGSSQSIKSSRQWALSSVRSRWYLGGLHWPPTVNLGLVKPRKAPSPGGRTAPRQGPARDQCAPCSGLGR